MNAKYRIMMIILFSTTWCRAGGNDWEWYVSMYGGWSQTGSGHVDGSSKQNTYDADGQLIEIGIKYPIHTTYDKDASFLLGGRAGVWLPFSENWLGLAGDLAISRIDSGSDDTEIILVPLSVLLLYRFPLFVSEDFPHGRLQPYAGIGLAGVIGDVSTKVEREDGSTYTTEMITAAPGGSAHLGCAWCIEQHLSVFFEYRYLLTEELSGSGEIHDDWRFPADEDTYRITNADIKTSTIEAHQLFGGVTISF